MKRLYTLLIVLLAHGVAGAETFEGYLITKNGHRLTGRIGVIFYAEKTSNVVFINDFGTEYNIHPALVKGFVFEKNNQKQLYLSKMHREGWAFLRVLYHGEKMKLYQAPEEKTVIQLSGDLFEQTTVKLEEYWIETEGRPVYRLNKMSFKRKFRRLVEKNAPELAAKIGRKGYQFKDLLKVVEEYNKLAVADIKSL